MAIGAAWSRDHREIERRQLVAKRRKRCELCGELTHNGDVYITDLAERRKRGMSYIASQYRLCQECIKDDTNYCPLCHQYSWKIESAAGSQQKIRECRRGN